MIVGQKKLFNLMCFLKNKIRTNMVILVFRGNKGEDSNIFLREYKKACISRGLRSVTKWLKCFFEILKRYNIIVV